MRLFRALCVASVGVFAAAAWAQHVDPRRPRTVTVGMAVAPSPMDRTDAKRSGLATSPLPLAQLHVDWRKPISSSRGLDHAPIVLNHGDTLVVSLAGEAVWIEPDGTERARLSIGATGAPVLLSDGTLVALSPLGDVVGFSQNAVLFRTRIASDRGPISAHASLLPLADGGVAVCAGADLYVLDATGMVRTRALAPDVLGTALVATRGKLFAATANGVVYSWVPGRDVSRVGSFGGTIDDGIAVLGDHTLVAMIDPAIGSRLVVLDVDTGIAITRASAPGIGAYLGPPALLGDVVYGLAAAPGRSFVVALDSAGQEKLRVQIVSSPVVADAGAAVFTPPQHTGVVVDASGTIAFAGSDGVVGVMDRAGTLTTLGPDLVCGNRNRTAQIVGIAPAGPKAFVVACAAGTLVRVSGI